MTWKARSGVEAEIGARSLKQKQIVVSIGLLLVLMGLLYMLWRIYMHTKRLRNELLQEKDSLTASEKQLRVVTKEAEAANRKKAPLSPISAMRCVRR